MTIINYKFSPSSGFRHYSTSYNFATMCFHLGPDLGYNSKRLEKFCDDASGLQCREYLKCGCSLTCQEDKWSLNTGWLKKSLTLFKTFTIIGIYFGISTLNFCQIWVWRTEGSSRLWRGLCGTVEVYEYEGLAVLQKCLQISPHIYQHYESPCKNRYS